MHGVPSSNRKFSGFLHCGDGIKSDLRAVKHVWVRGMTHPAPRCRCPVVSPFPEFPATASSSCGVGESIRGPEDVPIGRRGLTGVDSKWPTSQWEGETTPLADVTHGPQDSFSDLQPTIAELEAGWLMQERVSELRSRFTNPATVSSPPALSSDRRASRKRTILRTEATCGIHDSKSSSDIPTHP